MKRIVLFLATNLAVMLVLSVATSVLGVNKFLTANGLNIGMLLAFSAVIGFGGAFILIVIRRNLYSDRRWNRNFHDWCIKVGKAGNNF